MRAFSGFPIGKLAYTPLPDLFLGELLPLIDNLAELKVTLFVFWLLHRKKGARRYVTLQDLRSDGGLMRSLQGLASAPEEALREGLEKAVARGTLLCLVSSKGDDRFYFVNSGMGRQAFEQAQLGEIELAEGTTLVQPVVPVERPNIFVLYEQNIGLLQPIIAEELVPIKKPPIRELTACLLAGRLSRNLPVTDAERKGPPRKGTLISPTNPRGWEKIQGCSVLTEVALCDLLW